MVVIHQSNVKSTKTVHQQHTVFKLMVFPSVKTIVKKLNVVLMLSVGLQHIMDPVYVTQDIKEIQMI
jgi:hypothetical protein